MKLPQESTIKIGGVEYRLSKFDLNLVQEYQEWAKSVLPDPFDGLAGRIKDLPPDLQREIYFKAEAKADRRCTEEDSEYAALVQSVRGVKKMMHLLFRKYQPHVTEDQVAEIVTAGIEEHGEGFLSKCFPELPGQA